MSKSKIAIIIDCFFVSISVALLFFVWIKRITKNAKLSYFYLILIFLLLFLAYLFFKIKSYKKYYKKKLHKNFIDSCLKYLSSCPTKEYISFVKKLLNCNYINNFLFSLNNNYFYINFRDELSSEQFFIAQDLFYENKNEDSKLFFIYKNKSKIFDELLSISTNKYETINYSIIEKIMIQKEIYPLKETVQNRSFKEKSISYLKIKTAGISQKHFKDFFFSGLSLLFLSFVVPFSFYYLLFGSLLLILSIVTIFIKNQNTKSPAENLLLK